MIIHYVTEATNSTEFAPVHDTSTRALPAPMIYGTFNLMDALTEPAPSTSQACPNLCPSEKPIRKKVPKEEQVLIAFSSASSSSESVPHVKNKTLEKEVQCKMVEDMNKSPAKINGEVKILHQIDNLQFLVFLSLQTWVPCWSFAC
ncbi:unnamed protein product [Parnassius mnemosyne]|uniref:Uncharacterized protein n=1 Tax=Parnassius mnemosyne TaxID=213953 RepID=A0AAV1LNW1_9NEOP